MSRSKISFFLEEKIVKYINVNYTYKDISDIIYAKHKKYVSVRSIKRFLKRKGLKRKNMVESELVDIVSAMWQEVENSGSNLGYRSMRQKLQKEYHLTVKQKTVLSLLRIIDPEGVERRKSRRLHRRQYSVPGPNFVWHFDGHDKLNLEGFAIHGCIDGFSRKLLYLEVSTTNKDPRVIAHYFCKTVKKYGCLPTLLRTDKGTENVFMAEIQQCLRSFHSDSLSGEKSYVSGKSTANQRIESAWCQLRKHLTDTYMNLFKDLQENNLLDITNPLHIENLRYCFGTLLQHDLNMYRKEWNEHRIRNQPAREVKGGIPNLKYYVPQENGGRECKQSVDLEDVEVLSQDYTTEPRLISSEFKSTIEECITGEWPPVTFEDATNLYLQILQLLDKEEDDNDHS